MPDTTARAKNISPQKPEKTYTDAQGAEVPVRYVKQYDRERDRIARRVLARWEKARQAVARCYAETVADIEKIEAAASEGRQGARGLGTKGNFQFQSFDGLIMVARIARYELRFDERLRVALEIIEQMIQEKAQGIDQDIAELIRAAFRPTSDGLLSQGRVMGLFRLKIRHARWAEAMDLIRESIESRRGKTLLRVARKASREAEWQTVAVDIAAVADNGENDSEKGGAS